LPPATGGRVGPDSDIIIGAGSFAAGQG
jgi:hypothetical protein